MAKLDTGIEGLDRILMGGVSQGHAVLLEGAPGAGKTTLGLQFIHHGIVASDQPGMIITFEEFPQQMYRDAETLGWDLKKLSDENKLKIVSTSPAVFQQETAGPTGMISQMAREMGAERVLIDSVSHFQRLSRDVSEQREIFNGFVNMLKRAGFTTLMTQEIRSRDGGEVSFEQYACDTAIRLTYESVTSTRRARFLEVVKARGQEFLSGKHWFDIGPGGITVYPWLQPVEEEGTDRVGVPFERISSGVVGLDEMLHGGFFRGFITLLEGPSGTGKTTLGLQFLAEGARAGEPGLIVSLKARPSKLRGLARNVGIPLDGERGWKTIAILYESPLTLNPYRLSRQVVSRLEQDDVRRVVIDSLREIATSLGERQRCDEFLFDLIENLHHRGVSTMLIGEGRATDDPAGLAASPTAAIVDTIVGFRYVENRGEIRNGLFILKSRGSSHVPDVRPYTITARGVDVTTRRVTVFEE